jgi:hypothetical protein
MGDARHPVVGCFWTLMSLAIIAAGVGALAYLFVFNL